VSTLDPARTERTPLDRLDGSRDVAAGLRCIDAAIQRHFPENLFDDLDLVATSLAAHPRPLAHAERIAAVHALFGRETPLCFRYAHDFLYGFDWARWVARDPSTRAHVGPYDDAFLAYSAQRAAELTRLVADADPKYGPLELGAHRNPFPFRRDLEAERELHRALAAAGEIPVPGWDTHATPVWDRPFTAIREARAQALGLGFAGTAPAD
jgi:hypothetical protein